MRRQNVVAIALLFVATTAAAEIRGAWTAEVTGDGSIQMNLSHGHSQHGETMALADFSGISPAAVRAAAPTPVNFELRREAGTVAFEGTFKNGFGAGQFTFMPNSNYRATLRSLGVTSEDGDRDAEQEMLTMALLDVSTDFIRSMQAAGYRVPAKKYVAMRIFRVTPEFIREMKDAGYEHIPVQKLIAMRIHGIDANFVRKMNGVK